MNVAVFVVLEIQVVVDWRNDEGIAVFEGEGAEGVGGCGAEVAHFEGLFHLVESTCAIIFL